MKFLTLKAGVVWASIFIPASVAAQDSSSETSGLLQPEELETLVGPVALYPDTLLIQMLVAATYPLEIVKADRMLADNSEVPAEELKPKLEAEGWDESVTVLATAFPDVLDDMATHIEWTEAVGNAMLAQSDDVMDAVQTQRQAANDAGNLASGDEQTVEVVQEGDEETIIIQPTDPEVVYVPQYDTETIYVDDPNSDVNDALATGLLVFGAVAIMSEIFDDDDPWQDYWGCRNCGGWHGRPVVRNPDIDIDIDGNVNIGNRDNVAWKPDERRQREARDEITRRRGGDGVTTMPVAKPDRGDELRSQLSRQSGAADISRSNNPRAAGERPAGRPAPERGSAADRAAPAPGRAPANVRPPQRAQRPERKAAPSGGAMQRRAPSSRASAGAARSRSAPGGRNRR